MRTRATDADRDRCTARLREAFALGCLDHAELEERVELATLARTRAQLELLTADLPDPEAEAAARTGGPLARRRAAWVASLDHIDKTLLRAHATVFGLANGAYIAIWAATGGGDFWPAWLLVPWTPFLATHAAGSYSARRLARGLRGAPPRRRRIRPGRA